MLTLQPVNARLWVAREDPQDLLYTLSFGGKCTQPKIIVTVTGTLHAHAGTRGGPGPGARFDRHFDDRGVI